MNNIIDHVDKNTRFSPAMQKKNREISQLFYAFKLFGDFPVRDSR